LEGVPGHAGTDPHAFERVVVRLAEPIARRGDGAIRATISIDGVNVSVAGVRHGTTCYTGAVVLKKKAKLGKAVQVGVALRDGDGKATEKGKLRAERPGDDHGRPAAC
jgi:hypothetical protein